MAKCINLEESDVEDLDGDEKRKPMTYEARVIENLVKRQRLYKMKIK